MAAYAYPKIMRLPVRDIELQAARYIPVGLILTGQAANEDIGIVTLTGESCYSNIVGHITLRSSSLRLDGDGEPKSTSMV
jgi:hypothetical protein